MCLADVQRDICSPTLFFFLFFFKGSDCSHVSRRNTNHTFMTHDTARAPSAAHNISGLWMQVWMGEGERVMKGGELIAVLHWIQMRERPAEFWSSCLLFFSSVLHVSPSIRMKILQRRAPFWTGRGDVFRSTFRSQGPGPPLKEASILKTVELKSSPWFFDESDGEQHFQANLIMNPESWFVRRHKRLNLLALSAFTPFLWIFEIYNSSFSTLPNAWGSRKSTKQSTATLSVELRETTHF